MIIIIIVIIITMTIIIIIIIIIIMIGISNGPIQFESARKIWPLLGLLAKII